MSGGLERTPKGAEWGPKGEKGGGMISRYRKRGLDRIVSRNFCQRRSSLLRTKR